MFKCDRCGSRYSSMHAAMMENCPRCLIRDRVSSPLAFKVFQLPTEKANAEAMETGEAREERGEAVSA